jgi:hypothetical protein
MMHFCVVLVDSSTDFCRFRHSYGLCSMLFSVIQLFSVNLNFAMTYLLRF